MIGENIKDEHLVNKYKGIDFLCFKAGGRPNNVK